MKIFLDTDRRPESTGADGSGGEVQGARAANGRRRSSDSDSTTDT